MDEALEELERELVSMRATHARKIMQLRHAVKFAVHANMTAKSDMWSVLKALPANTATNPDLPTGKFWIIKHAGINLCAVYQPEPSDPADEVSFYRQEDLDRIGYTTIRQVIEVER